jgi:hypothetical protein
LEITSFFFHTLDKERFEIKTLQIRASLKNALSDIQILIRQVFASGAKKTGNDHMGYGYFNKGFGE